MKKIATILLVAILVVVGMMPAFAEAVTGDLNGDGKIIVGYISKNVTDVFHATLNGTAETYMAQMIEEGYIDEWTGILDGKTDPSEQINLADICISKSCDYVIILPAESAASDPAVVNMAEAGIGVIVVNSSTVSTTEKAITYVGCDEIFAGELMANFVTEQIPDGGVYVHCQGVIGNSAQIDRGIGILNILGEEWECAADVPCDWQADRASNTASDYIAMYGEDLKAIICDNDDMSSAAQQTCNELGRSDIICIGVDGNRGPLSMVKAGTLKATVFQDGVGQITQAIDCVVALCKGETLEATYTIPYVLVTSENIDDYYTE